MADKHAEARVLRETYDRLFAAYGPQHWWPGRTPTEVVVGAILTQNTAWTNVERAIANLRQAGCLTWSALDRIQPEKLAELIRPSGCFNLKAGRLKAFVDVVSTQYGRSLKRMLGGEIEEVRVRLLAIRGIGPETADSILLYAGGRATFVVDAYTKRILRRHGLLPDRDDYETIRRFFQNALPRDATVYNEYHALIVRVGKDHCRASARCDACPLEQMPHDGE